MFAGIRVAVCPSMRINGEIYKKREREKRKEREREIGRGRERHESDLRQRWHVRAKY